MAQPVTQFWPVFACKSDGHDVVNQKGAVLRNGPSQTQLDRTPNEHGQCDYYRLIEKDEPKHIDWRKKLGGMLLREIGGKQHESKVQQCILWDFPANYRLYEHIKSKVDGQPKVKNHSGGGHDRQDAYLYGYPKGPKKRFRSPVEFFPHLLWLCTDEQSDYQNCSCRICSPVQLESEKPKPEVKQEPPPPPANANNHVVNAASTPHNSAPAGRHPSVQIPMRRPSSTSTPTAQSPSAKPATPNTAPGMPPHNKSPGMLQSTPLPQLRSLEQQVDSQYGKFLGRTGEVIWYRIPPKTQAWGLGLVVRRWTAKSENPSPSYLIQPLSHPFESPEQVHITSDQDLMPWLAWSAPSYNAAILKQHTNLLYEQVDWRALISSPQYAGGFAHVDASIMAAKSIDATYTLGECLKTSAKMGTEERHYNYIYLGAEKIWNGEPVRLRLGSGTDLMVISDIVERTVSPTQPNAQSMSKILVTGDIYTFATLPAPDRSKPPSPPQINNNIPLRMREDIKWRNELLIPQNKTFAYWNLMTTNARLEISEIKGRWYETSILFVDAFKDAVKNNAGGNGVWMNSRGDAAGLGRSQGIPRSDRISAFGPSIPRGSRLVEGIDPPEPQENKQQQQQHLPPQNSMPNNMSGLDINMGSGGGGSGSGSGSGAPPSSHTDFALDDFMNLEGMDEGNGFGEYNY